jgi:hypothetical protein
MVSLIAGAATLASRCDTDPVPGIGRIEGDRARRAMLPPKLSESCQPRGSARRVGCRVDSCGQDDRVLRPRTFPQRTCFNP